METYKFEFKNSITKSKTLMESNLAKQLAMELVIKISKVKQINELGARPKVLSGRRSKDDCPVKKLIRSLSQIIIYFGTLFMETLLFWPSSKFKTKFKTKLKNNSKFKIGKYDSRFETTLLLLCFITFVFSGLESAEKSSDTFNEAPEHCAVGAVTLTRDTLPGVLGPGAPDPAEEVGGGVPCDQPRSAAPYDTKLRRVFLAVEDSHRVPSVSLAVSLNISGTSSDEKHRPEQFQLHIVLETDIHTLSGEGRGKRNLFIRRSWQRVSLKPGSGESSDDVTSVLLTNDRAGTVRRHSWRVTLKTFECVTLLLTQVAVCTTSVNQYCLGYLPLIGWSKLPEHRGQCPITDGFLPAKISHENRFQEVNKLSSSPGTGTAASIIPMGIHGVGLLSNRRSNSFTMAAQCAKTGAWVWPGRAIMQEPSCGRRLLIVTSLSRGTEIPLRAGAGKRVMTGHSTMQYSSSEGFYLSSSMAT